MKSLMTPVLLAIIGLWLAFSLSRFVWHVRAGQQLRRGARAFQRAMPSAPTKILVAGDSVAVGLGASQPEQSIAGLFGQDFPQADVTNVGVSGAETDGLVTQLAGLAGQHFSAVVLIIGANDVVHGRNLRGSLIRLDRALQQARELSDQVILMPEGNMGNAPIFPRLASVLLTP